MMKTNIFLKGLLAAMLFLSASCGEDFLTVVPQDQLDSEAVFSDSSGGDLFLSDIYNNLPIRRPSMPTASGTTPSKCSATTPWPATTGA